MSHEQTATGLRRLIDQPQLLHEAAVSEAHDARRRTAQNEREFKTFDQPGTEGIESLELGEVDVDAKRIRVMSPCRR